MPEIGASEVELREPIVCAVDAWLDYVLDMTAWLAGASDTIAAGGGVVAVDAPAEVEIGNATLQSTPVGDVTPAAPAVFDAQRQVRVWLRASAKGQYRIGVHVRTDGDRTPKRWFTLEAR